MKQESYFGQFVRYCSLSVLGTLGVSCYILADTFFVAQGLGTKGLAALNIAIPVYNFIHGTGLMLGMGGATRFSICRSTGDREEAKRIVSHSVCLAVLFGILFAMAGLFGAELLSGVLGADSDIFGMTSTYLEWLLLFAPAFILNDVLLCFVRNDDGPLLSAAAMLAGSIANIILDYILIFPMKLGIFGAVFATGLSPLISMAVMALHLFGKRCSLAFGNVRRDGAAVRRIFSLGFPSLVGQLATGAAMMIFNVLILGLEGNVGVAAYGVIANLSLVVTAVYTGLSQGVQPLLSRSHGAGDGRGVRLGLRYAVIAALAMTVLINGVIWGFAEPITAIFNSEKSLRMQELAETGLLLYFISSPFVGFNSVIAVYFTSVERPAPAHILSLLRGFVLLVPAAVLMAMVWGMTGIWLTCPVVEGIAAVLGCGIFLFGDRLQKQG